MNHCELLLTGLQNNSAELYNFTVCFGLWAKKKKYAATHTYIGVQGSEHFGKLFWKTSTFKR